MTPRLPRVLFSGDTIKEPIMTRIDPYKIAPDAIKAMMTLENYVQKCGLEHSLIELVKMRASQINGCAFCIDMHTHDARQSGESEDRLYMLSAWRESSRYTDRERAALAWTEALTLISQTHAGDKDYERVLAHFSEKEAVNLTLLIMTINAWNRLAVGFRFVPLSERDKAAA
jgi:AhpD family alkylhydroperoxidase